MMLQIILCITGIHLSPFYRYRKTCVNQPLSKRSKLFFKTNYRLMQVIKLPFVIMVFVLYIFEWPFYTVRFIDSESIINIDFLISQLKYMLWVLKRTISFKLLF